MTTGDLFAELIRVAREAGAEGIPEVLSDRADGQVVRVSALVVKAHPAATDPLALRARLRTASAAPLRDILVAPLTIHGDLLCFVHERPVTAWPHGSPVDPGDPDSAPWEQSATLLARLHRIALARTRVDDEDPQNAGHPEHLPHRFPIAGAPARVHRAIARLRGAHTASAATKAVLRAFDTLPPLDNAPKTLVHGDFHLGQLVRLDENRWRLIDVDDLGVGDPVWDLARPAGYFAAGILEPLAWQRFLNAYRRGGGPAVPPRGDEWAALDVPARALVVQAAALAVAKSPAGLDDLDLALIDACVRMTALPYGG
ncbi:phosphotransferase family protein [Nocardia wallacei]|uniref:phosphotransferase family protein n=1 Tax=Nocardia wallacei TaxID=480035 RepID=UPI002458E757|nr:aminoglycoside phosphotransferase family protein [Nocardia wallacei]